MPGGDRTGPWGMGPQTGRGAGYCAGYPAPGYMNPIGRGGGGRGFGRGRGRRHGFLGRGMMYGVVPPAYGYGPGMPAAAAPTREQELEFLKAQAEELKGALESIRRRIDELGAAEVPG